MKKEISLRGGTFVRTGTDMYGKVRKMTAWENPNGMS